MKTEDSTMTATTINEEAFLERIARGEKIEATDTMPEEYRENLINLLMMQADSELSGAYGYVPWIEKAPNIHEKLLVAQIVKDEIRHAYVVNKCLAELGVDVDSRIEQQDFAYRLNSDDVNIGSERLAQDKRVNIFYYPIETWTDFIMFNFCMDRGAGHQLEDALESSYGPWVRAIQTIFKEEMMHVNHGDTWVEKLAKDPATRNETQEALNKWFCRTMNIFGRPGSRRNVIYQKWGLKKRDNDQVRAAFRKEIEEKVQRFGLEMPEWTPDYD
jgi:ring-1,2-phenylacetyl-CoA epoxidase subunit PaaA